MKSQSAAKREMCFGAHFRVPSWAQCFLCCASQPAHDLLGIENAEVFSRKLTESFDERQKVIPEFRYPGVKRLSWGDRESAVDVASRSFLADPKNPWDWVLGEEIRKPENKDLRKLCFVEIMELAFKLTMEIGLVYGLYEPQAEKPGGSTRKQKLVAVSFIMPPGRRFDNGKLLRLMPEFRTTSLLCWMMCFSGMEMPPHVLDSKLVPGFKTRLQEFEKISSGCFKAENPNDDAINVLLLAVDPEFQGKGFGKSLLESLLDSADRLRRTVYLESSEKTRSFFEHLGFRAGKTFPLTEAEEEKSREVLLNDDEYKSHEDRGHFICPMVRPHGTGVGWRQHTM